MEIIEAIKTRKSIRKFTEEPVSDETLKAILEIASRSPSAENTQPWEFFILQGEVLDKIKSAVVAKIQAGEMPPQEMSHLHVERPKGSLFRKRQVDIAKQLFGLMSIAREDTQKRMEWILRGFCYFGAPQAIVVAVDNCIPVHGGAFDVGGLSQTICLTALAYGLSTCIENQGVTYADVIRKYVGIPDTHRLMIAIAIGYADCEFPANRVESEREPIDNIIHFRKTLS